MNTTGDLKQVRIWTAFVIVILILIGISVFPLQAELEWLGRNSRWLPGFMSDWVARVREGIVQTNASYPFIAYGTDWLGFAHIIIGLAFVGVWRDPVKNKWIVDWGILCCILVFPVAFIAGPARGIPLFHRFIDSSFGIVGAIPLLIIHRKIRNMEQAG